MTLEPSPYTPYHETVRSGAYPACYGSSFMTLHSDLETVNSDPDNPFGGVPGSQDTPDAVNMRIAAVPHDANMLSIMAYVTSTIATQTFNQAPIMNVFGLIPHPYVGGDQRKVLPEATNSTFESLNVSTVPGLRGLWIPLPELGYTEGTLGVTLDQVGMRIPIALITGDQAQLFSEPRYIPTMGCTHIMAMCATAGTYTTGSETESVVCLGWFSSPSQR